MSPQKTTTVGVRMTEERREELEQEVEQNPEYNSVPDLLRTAAAHELSEEYGYLPSERDGDETGGEILAAVQGLQAEMEDIRAEVRRIPDEVRYERTRDEGEIKDAILQALPKSQSGALSLSELSEEIESDTQRVTRILDYLNRETSIVDRTEDGKWYREA